MKKGMDILKTIGQYLRAQKVWEYIEKNCEIGEKALDKLENAIMITKFVQTSEEQLESSNVGLVCRARFS